MTKTGDPQAPRLRGPGEGDVPSLVSKARDGSQVAFEQLMDRYQDGIFRMAYIRTRSWMDAEDLTQDVFLQAFRNIGSLKDNDRFRPWLMSIAVNRVRDFHRRRKVLSLFGFSSSQREDEEPPEETAASNDPGPLSRLLQGEFWRQIERFGDRLSQWEREVFFLRFFDHLGLREIALVLGKSESAVKTHLYRAIKKFRDDPELVDFLDGELP
jgi:RNA polymerase sigma-70 factor, ECF subfamily